MKCWLLLVFGMALGSLSWGQDFFSSALRSFRVSQGLEMPIGDEKLTLSSQQRARALALAGVLSHEDEQGRGPGLQMVEEGLPLGEFGEVLGSGADPKSVWEAWLASPSHRAILVNSVWTHWGWGSAEVGRTSVFVLRFRGP